MANRDNWGDWLMDHGFVPFLFLFILIVLFVLAATGVLREPV